MEKVVMDQTASAVPVVQTPLYNLVVIGDAPDLIITVTRIASSIPGISIMASTGDDFSSQHQHSILCSVAPDGRRTFCGEYTQASALDSEALAADISRTIVPDVPVYAWIPTEKNIEKDYPWLAPQVDVLIVNEYAFEPTTTRYTILDMSWLRLTQWMEAIAKVFDVPEIAENVCRLTSIRMHKYPQFKKEPASARLMAGWSMYCLKECFPAAQKTAQGLMLASDRNDRQLCISADDWRDFDEIELVFGMDSSLYVDLKLDGGSISIEGNFVGKQNHPARSDAELLADEINGKNAGSLYSEIVRTMQDRDLW